MMTSSSDLATSLFTLLSSLDRAIARPDQYQANARRGRDAAALVRLAMERVAETDAPKQLLREAAAHLRAMNPPRSNYSHAGDGFGDARRAMTACFLEISERENG